MICVIKVAYEGSFFSGLQRQPGHDTVQGHLESALSRFFGRPIATTMAGRTDTGVHALAQVMAFFVEAPCDLEKLTHSLNAMARSPVAVLEAAILDDSSSFHPRHSALSRTYNYLIVDDCGYPGRLFWRGRAWTIGARLDLSKMRAATRSFLGEHDFTTYSYQPDETMTRVRKVTELSLQEEPLPTILPSDGRLLRLEITANGFLRRMVRTLTSELVQVGLGQEAPETLAQKLAAKDPELGPPAAPAHGLYFKAARYSPDPFKLGRQSGLFHRTKPSQSLNFQDRTGRLN